MEQDTQRINIRGDTCLLSQKQLGRHVVGRSSRLADRLRAAFGELELGQPEVGEHRPRAALGRLAQNNVAALEVPVDHALAVRLGQTGAGLERNFPRLFFRHGSRALDPAGERLARKELHAKEVHFPKGGFRRVQVVELADIEVAYFAGGARLRWQPAPEAQPRALDRDAAVQLPVQRLVDHAHAAPADLADDAEPSAHHLSQFERPMFGPARSHQGLPQEAAHAFFPFDPPPHFFVEDRIRLANRAQVFVPFVGRALESRFHQRHHELVEFGFVWHFNLSNSQQRASPYCRCMVRSRSPRASAVSSSVKPRKNLNSTMEHHSECAGAISSSNPSMERASSTCASRPRSNSSRSPIGTFAAFGRLRACSISRRRIARAAKARKCDRFCQSRSRAFSRRQ